MSASGIATRQKAEDGHKKLFYASQPKPLLKGTKISFSPLSGLGLSAFYWNGVIAGHTYSGADAFKGTTGYFTEISTPLVKTMVDKLEELVLAA